MPRHALQSECCTLYKLTCFKITEYCHRDAKIFTIQGDQQIGKKYKKALYREFTDATFEKKKERAEYLGVLGPTLYAEVGDTIEVVFKNKAKRAYSVHPHGVFYR